jgi:hypothetical protein
VRYFFWFMCFFLAWFLGFGVWGSLYSHGYKSPLVAVAVFAYFTHGAWMAARSNFFDLD